MSGMIFLLLLTTQFSWQVIDTMPNPRWGGRAVPLEEGVLLIGGEDETGPSDAVELFRIQDRSWQELCSLPYPLRDFAVVSFNGQIYVLGGRTALDSASSAVLIYSLEGDSFSIAPFELPRKMYGMEAQLVGEKVYLFGGIVDSVYLPRGYVIDLNDFSVDSFDLNVERSYFGSALYCGIPDTSVYLLGGLWYDYLSSVEKFDPGEQTWSGYDELPEPRAYHVSMIYGNTLMVIGGEIDGQVTSSVLRSPFDGPWYPATPMFYARADLMGTLLGDSIFVFGGYTYDNSQKVSVPYVEKYSLCIEVNEPVETVGGSLPVRAPNPIGRGDLIVVSAPVLIELYSPEGRLVRSLMVDSPFRFDELGLKAGVYLALVRSGQTERITKWLYLP